MVTKLSLSRHLRLDIAKDSYDDMQEIRQVDTDADTARATLEQAQAEMYKNLNYLIKVQLAETKDEQARELFMHGEEGGFFY